MRALMLIPLLAPMVWAAPPPLPLEEAAQQILQTYEDDPTQDRLPSPPVKPKDRAGRDWLLACLKDAVPSNPFPAGTKAHREAEALRAFLRSPVPATAGLSNLPLRLSGTQAALWRWGKALARQGDLSKPIRHAWEDRLMAPGGHPLIRGWALRHAFCFALAEGDEARFGQMKAALQDELPEQVRAFQRAFALLGGPPPRIYLWSLPDLEPLDIPLSRLGPCLAITPLEPGTPPPALGCTWILPCLSSDQPVGASSLNEPTLKEARAIAEQVRSFKRPLYLAPSREPFLDCALAYFPIEIHLGPSGLIEQIRMGDAALAVQAKPTP